jgi:hypothetical protein
MLAVGVFFFVVSSIIRLDATLLGFFWDLGDKSSENIDVVASAFGALGGLFVAGFYLWGYLAPDASKSEKVDS